MEQMELDTSHVMELMQAFNGQSSKSTPTSHGGNDGRADVSLSFLLQSRCNLKAYRKFRRQADEQMDSSFSFSSAIPVLVSTRAGISQASAPQKMAKSKLARLAARVAFNH